MSEEHVKQTQSGNTHEVYKQTLSCLYILCPVHLHNLIPMPDITVKSTVLKTTTVELLLDSKKVYLCPVH